MSGRGGPTRPDAAAPPERTVVTGHLGAGRTTALLALGAGASRVLRGGALRHTTGVDRLPLQVALGRRLRGSGPELAAAVAEAVGPGGVLLVDDLQWADRCTLEALLALPRTIAVAASVRTDDDAGEDLAVLLEAAGWSRTHLEDLDRGAAAALVRAELGSRTTPGGVAAVVARAGGNPRLLVELAADPVLRDVTARELVDLVPDVELAEVLAVSAGEVTTLPSHWRARLHAAELVTEAGDLRWPVLAEAAAAAIPEARCRQVAAALAAELEPSLARARHLLRAGESSPAASCAEAVLASTSEPVERAAASLLVVEASSAPSAAARRRASDAAIAVGDLERALDLSTSGDGARTRARAWRYGVGRAPEPSTLPPDELAWLMWLSSAQEPPRAVSATAPGAALVRLADALAHRADLPDASRPEGDDDDPLAQVTVSTSTVLSALLRGEDTEAALQQLHTAARRLLRTSPVHARVAGLQGVVDLHRGGSARALAQHAAPPRVAGAVVAAHTALALAELGRTAEASEVLDDLDGATRGTLPRGVAAWARAEVELVAGRFRSVERAVDQVVDAFGSAHPLTALALLAASWAAFERGLPLPSLAAAPGPLPSGARAEAEALAVAADDPAAAVEAFIRAADRWSTLRRSAELRCRWAAGEQLARAGDLAGARAHLVDVEARAQAEGLLPLVARARQSLRRAGVTFRVEGAGRDGLTPREREALELVARGLTTTAIATELGVAASTVETHVAAAVRKLGARNRVQAANLLRRHGDVEVSA